MTLRDLTGADCLLHFLFQLQQADLIGHRALALADLQRQLRLADAGGLHDLHIRFRFFDGAQVLTLDVLDQRHLRHLHFVGVDDDDRDIQHAGDLHRTISPLSGHDLIAVVFLSDRDRVDQSVFPNGL